VPPASTATLGLPPSLGPSSIGARLNAACAGAAASAHSTAATATVHDHLRTTRNPHAAAGRNPPLSQLERIRASGAPVTRARQRALLEFAVGRLVANRR
jgi:hypothetical protein